MMIFEIATWVLFALTLGGCFAFFMERRGHTAEHLLSATAGAVIAGMLGKMVVALVPAIDWQTHGYSLTAFMFALAGSLVGVAIDRKTHRKGKHLFRDARPDVP
jgi:high-affinity Fe2+/Pb2+ permease